MAASTNKQGEGDITGKKNSIAKTVQVAAPPKGNSSKRSHDVASPQLDGSSASSPTPPPMQLGLSNSAAMASNDSRSLSDAFWDVIFTVTGFRKAQLDRLRETNEETHPTPDVVELVCPDLTWSDADVVHKLREGLQAYVEALRALKAENGKQLRSRPFVDQKRYEAMRSREATLRVTTERIMAAYSRLNLSGRRIASIGADVLGFSELTELNLSRNFLGRIAVLPARVQIVMASGNAIETVEPSALEGCPELYVLGLSSNRIRDVTFLLSSCTLVAVDLSYNPITSVDDIVAVLSKHPSIRDVSFIGCPAALCANYRARITANCPSIASVDGVSTAAVVVAAPPKAAPTHESSASPVASPRGVSIAPATAAAAAASTAAVVPTLPMGSAIKESPNQTSSAPTVHVNVLAVRGTQTLLPQIDPVDAARVQSAGKKAAAPAGGKKGANNNPTPKVEEERGPTTQQLLRFDGVWGDGVLSLAIREVELAPPQAPVEDTKGGKGASGAAGKKPAGGTAAGAAAAAAAAAADASIAQPDVELALKASLSGALDMDNITDLTPLLRRWLIDVALEEYVVLPQQQRSVSPTSAAGGGAKSPSADPLSTVEDKPARQLTQSQWLGTFEVPLYELLVAQSGEMSAGGGEGAATTTTAPPTSSTMRDTIHTIPMRLQRNTIANATTALQKQQRNLEELLREDARLDEILNELIATETAAATAAEQAAAAAAPANAKSAKPTPKQGGAPPQRILSDATTAKQQESAQRKVAIEEFTAALREEEKRVSRLSNANLSLLLQVSLNTPIPLEKPAEVAAPPPAAVAAGAKKK